MEVSTNSTTETDTIYDYINGYLLNPSVFIIIIVVIVIYVGVFLSLGNNNNSNSNNNSMFSYKNDSDYSTSSSEGNSTTKTIMIICIGIFILLAIINWVKYIFGVDIVASIKNLFTGKPEIEVQVTQPQPVESPVAPSYSKKKQVFNIPGNYYGFEDAKSLCKAYDAELATYQQVEESYKNGAEWCNYGWSDGQMALFPTQQNTFDQLQTIPGHENDCGRPGVNGGFIDNPRVQFGVNCYGYKPRITTEEEEMMKNTSPYPKTKKDLAMEQRVDYWKTKINEILVSPFNYNNWNS
jgi:preprotein translocase subunit SecG